MSHDHLEAEEVACLLNKELEAVPVALVAGFGLIQQAHFSLRSAFETRHVSQVHLAPCEVVTFVKRDGAAVVVAGVEMGVDLGTGFGVEQQAHFSVSSGLETRHVSQVHLATFGLLKIEVAAAALVGDGSGCWVSVCSIVSTIGLLQLEHTEAGVVSTDSESVVVFCFFTGVSGESGDLVSFGNRADLFGEVFIHRQLRQTIFRLSFE